ncbi:helix-turn-helix domain-containing protein [Pseudolysinimonas sp.]|uniref:helix-turn-helix domain-containing protein n=1 Tax=Pseudolysinimonas sp. TaxID=2680009 RepID=UPI003F812EAF
MLLRHAVGAALRRIRQDRELTLREVAAAARVSMPYLSEIERGRKEPSSEVLAGICAALGMTIVDLLDEARVELRPAAVIVDLSARRDERIGIAPPGAVGSAQLVA